VADHQHLRRGAAALALLVLQAAVVTTAVVTPSPSTVAAADLTPWTSPTMPPQCSTEKARTGDVGNCLLSLGGSPVERGLGDAPFPFPAPGVQIPWAELGRGSDGHVVLAVQQALAANGWTPVQDGVFGTTTTAAVKGFQAQSGLPITGVVDEATAARLGVVNTEPGAFPPPGYRFNGWAYNGSPALAEWEAMMVRNQIAVGGIGVGRLTGHPDVMGLFEGFLSDLQQNGYAVRDAGMYAFRCTSNSRMNCAGKTPDSLSNHAWGIAIDLNSGANPELTYTAPGDGTSACAVPVKTDFPQWAIQVAEKWGLYWGGYGYSRTCSTPDTMRDSILRDATHFEYRGDVASARAILQHNTGRTTNTRLCVASAGDDGVVRNVCSDSRLPMAGWRLPIDVGAPVGATAALVNIAMTEAGSAGFVTAEGCGPLTTAVRQWANGTFAAGTTVSNLSVVPLDAKGRFCLYANARVHTIVDVQGFFVPASKAGSAGFVAIPQRRVLDTRDAGTAAPGGTATALPAIADVPAGAVAVLVNAAVTESSSAGYLSADRCSRFASGPSGSANVNFAAGSTVSNLAVVPVAGGAAGCLWPMVATHLVVDAQGAFVPGAGLGMSLVGPKRLVDTRTCAEHSGASQCGVPVAGGQMVKVTGARGSAALVNLVLTDAKGDLFAVADTCDVLATARPLRANANTSAGKTVSNLAVVPLASDGSFCVWVSASTHVIVDIQGVFEANGPLRFLPQDPSRRQDTRAL
jgi:hypothetical protein